MSKQSDMCLYVWSGNWGLPSVDRECCAVTAYCRFANCHIRVVTTGDTSLSPSGKLPFLKDGSTKVVGMNAICAYLRKKNYSADHALGLKQSADVVAYDNYLRTHLSPVLLDHWWLDTDNYSSLTRPWYNLQVPLTLRFRFPYSQHWRVKQSLQALHGDYKRSDLIANAKQCINSLEAKLGHSTYFGGDSPCSLDAIVYSYLVAFMFVPFASSDIQHHVKACENISRLCMTIHHKYFPELRTEPEVKPFDAGDFRSRTKSVLVCGAVAVSAMMLYSYSVGLIPTNS